MSDSNNENTPITLVNPSIDEIIAIIADNNSKASIHITTIEDPNVAKFVLNLLLTNNKSQLQLSFNTKALSAIHHAMLLQLRSRLSYKNYVAIVTENFDRFYYVLQDSLNTGLMNPELLSQHLISIHSTITQIDSLNKTSNFIDNKVKLGLIDTHINTLQVFTSAKNGDICEALDQLIQLKDIPNSLDYMSFVNEITNRIVSAIDSNSTTHQDSLQQLVEKLIAHPENRWGIIYHLTSQLLNKPHPLGLKLLTLLNTHNLVPDDIKKQSQTLSVSSEVSEPTSPQEVKKAAFTKIIETNRLWEKFIKGALEQPGELSPEELKTLDALKSLLSSGTCFFKSTLIELKSESTKQEAPQFITKQ